MRASAKSSTAHPISPPPRAASTRCCASFDAQLGCGPEVSGRRRTARPHRRRSAATTSGVTSTSCAPIRRRRRHRHARLHRRGAARRGRPDQRARSSAARRSIYQAAMFDGRFVGFADFLVLGRLTGTALRDTKLARSVKVEALLQLAAYADTLAAQRRPGGRRGRAGPRRRRRRAPTGSTSCCRSTCRAAPRCSGCSTSTSPASGRSAGTTSDVRACFRCPECSDRGPRRATTCCSSRACGSASAPA